MVLEKVSIDWISTQVTSSIITKILRSLEVCPARVSVFFLKTAWITCGHVEGASSAGLTVKKITLRYFLMTLGAGLCTKIKRVRCGYGESGLIKLDVDTGVVTKFTVMDGLPSNKVMGILEDANGFLWLSTEDAGISRFDPKTGTVRNYGLADGLQDVRFSWDAFHMNKSGELFFGGPAGVTAFFPDEILDNPHPPEMELTQLFVNGEVVRSGFDDLFSLLHPDSGGLKLPFQENDIAIDYVGLHYSHSEGNTYAYMLEGLDTDWREVGNLRRAAYPELSDGFYTFHVKAANSDGKWSEPISLSITIMPPWWRSIWAYMVYGLLFLAAVWITNRLQKPAPNSESTRESARASIEAREGNRICLSPARRGPYKPPDHPAAAGTVRKDGLIGSTHSRYSA